MSVNFFYHMKKRIRLLSVLMGLLWCTASWAVEPSGNLRSGSQNAVLPDTRSTATMWNTPVALSADDGVVTYTVSKTTGNMYNLNGSANQGWNAVWKSTGTPQLTFGCGPNNMFWSGDNVGLMSGQTGSAVYTLTAPAGYKILSYSFKLTNNNHDRGLTVTYGGSQYTTSRTSLEFTESDCGEHSVSFTLAGANGNGVIVSDFTVTIAPYNPANPSIVNVTYTYMMNGKELGSRTVTETVSAAPTDALPSYVSATGYPGVVEKDAYTIETAYNDEMPFTPALAVDDTPVYYRVNFAVNGYEYYWYANNENQGKETWDECESLTLDTERNFKWRFVGDWFNGFRIMTQSGKYLKANSASHNVGTALTEDASADNTIFVLDKYLGTEWRFNLKDTNLYLAHISHTNLNISLWNGVNYIGAKTYFHETGDFSELLAELEQEKANAEAYLAMDWIGTPTADATERVELASQVSSVADVIAAPNFKAYVENKEALDTKLSTYLNSTNLRMPENGKAYTITFRPTNTQTGTYRYINYDGTRLTNVAMSGRDAQIPETGVFVFRKYTYIDETEEEATPVTKYALVPAYGSVYGKYLNYGGNKNNANGANDSFTEGVNSCTIEALLQAETKTYITDQSAGNLFGYVYFLYDKRNSGNTDDGVYIMKEANAAYDNSGAPFLNGTYTSALIVREVPDYPSSVKLNEAAGINGAEGIGTFSAPYAAVVPEGVEAYYVKNVSDVNGETMAVAKRVEEGEVIPAGQGVLLTGTAGTYAVMAPATSETRATLDGNMLGHSAGAAKAIPATEKAYILTGKNGVVAFYNLSEDENKRNLAMNKSYLVVPAGVQPARVVLSFGDISTGIDNVAVSGYNPDAPVYDLSGRRVAQPVKGGVYIQAGKKYIVK